MYIDHIPQRGTFQVPQVCAYLIARHDMTAPFQANLASTEMKGGTGRDRREETA